MTGKPENLTSPSDRWTNAAHSLQPRVFFRVGYLGRCPFILGHLAMRLLHVKAGKSVEVPMAS